MEIKFSALGAYQTNCYVVYDSESLNGIIIDPGESAEGVNKLLKDTNVKLKGILLTHGHVDHSASVNYLISLFPEVDVYISSIDNKRMENRDFIFGEAPMGDNVVHVKENDELVFDSLKFRVIETPGHSDGSVCYLIDNVLFSGDTIFKGSYGRFDLPGGDGRVLMKSITEKLLKLDGKTLVYPGHGPSTTIEKEKIHYSYNY
ncbi:Metallo-beta-lactamase family protein [Clostridium bornimense]|uniref:Metallo-beta-lactamase family protein n=1 Tax=Clostridium bornimense TaxID=1216932 RepID=W6RWV7_9CLOT|nr:MBL fold metallo-hydrolase [Clostridium bornimense]CDM69161.1 Metallo-beta-lactamase family protein [Clostridium bornimense]